MTLECRNTWINYFQCKQGTQLNELNKSLSYGICPDKNLRNNTILSMYIDTLLRYVPFDDEVVFAYAITITKPGAEGSTGTVNVDINSVTYTGSSTGDAKDIADALAADLEAGGFETTVVDNIVYVWSYDPDLEGLFEGSTSNDNADSSDEDLTNNLGVILNLWNCLTLEQICAVIQYMKKYINLKCRC